MALADYVEESAYRMLGLDGALALLAAEGCFRDHHKATQKCCSKGGDGLNCNLDVGTKCDADTAGIQRQNETGGGSPCGMIVNCG